MTRRQGGAQGASQGNREFSLSASLPRLPGTTSEDTVQGGKAGDARNPRKSPKTGNESTPHQAPSLPESRTIRAVNDPLTLGKAARIVRAALARRSAPSDLDPKFVPGQHRESAS